jgi:hypothetical protein
MNTVNSYSVKLPDYSLSYLINGDESGISEEDKNIIDEYMQEFYDESESCNGDVIIGLDDIDSEGYFTWSPSFGLACTVFDATILIVN